MVAGHVWASRSRITVNSRSLIGNPGMIGNFIEKSFTGRLIFVANLGRAVHKCLAHFGPYLFCPLFVVKMGQLCQFRMIVTGGCHQIDRDTRS